MDLDRIGQQVASTSRPMIAMLPQGTRSSDFNPNPAVMLPNPVTGKLEPDKGFDANAFIDEVLQELVADKILPQRPAIAQVVLSGHSGGGSAISTMLAGVGSGVAPHQLGELVLMDAINGPGELSRIEDFLANQLEDDRVALQRLGKFSSQMEFLKTSFRLRAITSNNADYRPYYEKLQKFLDRYFANVETNLTGLRDGKLIALWKENYQIVVSGNHDHASLVGTGDLRRALEDLAPLSVLSSSGMQ